MKMRGSCTYLTDQNTKPAPFWLVAKASQKTRGQFGNGELGSKARELGALFSNFSEHGHPRTILSFCLLTAFTSTFSVTKAWFCVSQ
jgi:hypothetical protein